jgi:hypothetical protein
MIRPIISLFTMTVIFGCTETNIDCGEQGLYVPMRNGVLDTEKGFLYELVCNNKDSTVIDCTKVTVLISGEVKYINWNKKSRDHEEYRPIK